MKDTPSAMRKFVPEGCAWYIQGQAPSQQLVDLFLQSQRSAQWSKALYCFSVAYSHCCPPFVEKDEPMDDIRLQALEAEIKSLWSPKGLDRDEEPMESKGS